MKAIQLFIFCLAVFILAGCEPQSGKERLPDYSYDIYLEIVDAEGNHIAGGDLPQQDIDKGQPVIRPAYYTMKIFIDDNVSKPSGTGFYVTDDKYLMLATKIQDQYPRTVVIKYEITSETVFKDEAEHTLIVKWENPKNSASHICKEVRFDGFLMPISTNEFGKATIRIVLPGVHIHPE